MGKAQSKRSVDITTETKKGPDGEEVTGKLEKIEDIDQKQVNGDATPQEKNYAAGGGEKKDAPDETENDKDLTTEKTAAEAAAATPSPTTTAADGSGDQTANDSASPKEDAKSGDAAAATPIKEGEEISPLAEEGSNKKTKKEKLKKKWSFRSLSFGKKDKSKPKTESTENAPAANAENGAAATNGEAVETNKPAEDAIAEVPKSEEVAAAEVKPAETEKIENGVATEAEQKQMNGQKTPTSTDEQTEQKKPIETKNENAAAITITSPTPAVVTDTANENKIVNEKIETIVSNGTADVEKNGVAHDVEHEEEKSTIAAPPSPAAPEESNKSIPAAAIVDEKPHQNGTNGEEAVEELTTATKTLQIEVKTEHENDSNNSTTIINTTTSTSSNTTNNNNSSINPADIINTEQKTININNKNDDQNNFVISTIHTDTNTTNTTTNTNTNTSDKSFSSNQIIETSEEQSKVLLVPNAENSNIIELETKEANSETENLNKSIDKPTTEFDIEMQEQQQQSQENQEPPPLPVSAPPSQVIIFALNDNESQTNIQSDGIPPNTVEVLDSEKQPETFVQIAETLIETNAGEEGNLISITDEIIEVKEFNDDNNKSKAAEIIEVIEIEFNEVLPNVVDATTTAAPVDNQETSSNNIDDQFSNLEDFEAQALNIVHQIEKELEKEEAAADSDEKSEQEIEAIEIPKQQQEPLIEDEQEVKPMDLCSISSNEAEMENLPSPPPTPPSAELKEVEIIEFLPNLIDDTEEIIIAISNVCGNEIQIENQNEQHHHHNEEGDYKQQQKKQAQQLISENINMNNGENNDDDSDLIEKINKLNFNFDHEDKLDFDMQQQQQLQENVVAKKNIEHIEANNIENFVICTDDDDKEMPTAKELKENAAAAEIKTQDLPVTCE